MATPWECRAVPTSLGANPADICAPLPPAPPADPAAPVAAPAPGPAAPPAPRITAQLVSTALRQVPLPAPRLQVQPPGGRTLVNFETNVLTDPAGFTRTLTLLGQPVTLRISAAAYTWDFGDGTTTTTTTPGTPYPDLDVTHRYLTAATVQARVDTTYAADYRVGGGPWQPVPGTVTVTGAPEPLEVVEARPTLVG